MSRKNPSSHTDEQFALFVEKMREGVGVIDQARFKEMVRDLVLVDVEASDTLSGGTGKADRGDMTAFAEAAPPAASPAVGTRGSVAGPPALLPLIGQLVFQWSSSQALLIRLLGLMLGTDNSTAAMVFSALGTTQLRLDLVRRLALLKLADRPMRDELGKIMELFADSGRQRNELVYALYPVNAEGEVTHTHIMRLVSNDDGRMVFGDTRAIDEQRSADIVAVCQRLHFIEQSLEILMPQLKQHIAAPPLASAAD